MTNMSHEHAAVSEYVRKLAERFHDEAPSEEWFLEDDEQKARELWVSWVGQLLADVLREEGERVRREKFKGHQLLGIDCDYEYKTDTSSCECGWIGAPQSNVGLAFDIWLEHASCALTVREGTGK